MATKELSTLALVANGEISDYSAIKPLIIACERVFAIDGGLIHCHNMGLTPDYILGDFDSTPKELLSTYKHIPQKQFPKEKDQSDLELAITEAQPSNTKDIILFGALGKRMDHSLYNLLLLCRFPSQVFLQTESEWMTALKGKHRIPTKKGQTVSFLPVTSEPVTVTTSGLRWELTRENLSHHNMSLSNISLGDFFDIDVEQGVLVCSLVSG